MLVLCVVVVCQILSQSKNPMAVQSHCHKCFEGIHAVEFVERTVKQSTPRGILL